MYHKTGRGKTESTLRDDAAEHRVVEEERAQPREDGKSHRPPHKSTGIPNDGLAGEDEEQDVKRKEKDHRPVKSSSLGEEEASRHQEPPTKARLREAERGALLRETPTN